MVLNIFLLICVKLFNVLNHFLNASWAPFVRARFPLTRWGEVGQVGGEEREGIEARCYFVVRRLTAR